MGCLHYFGVKSQAGLHEYQGSAAGRLTRRGRTPDERNRGAPVTVDCPSDIAIECFKVPGYRYVSYDNSGNTPCGVSQINGAVAGICAQPNVRVTSRLTNGRNALPEPTVDGWDNCAIPFLNDFATTLNTWDPFAGNWSVAQSETCAYHVRSRAPPPTGHSTGA